MKKITASSILKWILTILCFSTYAFGFDAHCLDFLSNQSTNFRTGIKNNTNKTIQVKFQTDHGPRPDKWFTLAPGQDTFRLGGDMWFSVDHVVWFEYRESEGAPEYVTYPAMVRIMQDWFERRTCINYTPNPATVVFSIDRLELGANRFTTDAALQTLIVEPDPVPTAPTCQSVVETLSTLQQTLIELCKLTGDTIDKAKQDEAFRALKDAHTPLDVTRNVGVALCDPDDVDGQATLNQTLTNASTLMTAIEVGHPNSSLSDKINYYCNKTYRFTERIPVDPADYCRENAATIPGDLQTAYQNWQTWFTQAVNSESRCSVSASPDAEGLREYYALLGIVDRISQCRKADFYELVGNLENWSNSTTVIEEINKDRPSNVSATWYAQSINYVCNMMDRDQ